jgi:hypothetical protein
MNNQSQECCPRFDPTPWDGKVNTWRHKKFIKDKVFTILYMPLNYGAAMTRLQKKVDGTGAATPEALCLSEATSPWNTNVYLAVSKEVLNAENIELSGTFLSKVYEGDFSNTGKWFADFEAYAKEQKYTIEKMYSWYTTCPACAKKYGKNYVVIFGKIVK